MSGFSGIRRCRTNLPILLLYAALPAGRVHRTPVSIKQQVWSDGPCESSSPALKPFMLHQSLLLFFLFGEIALNRRDNTVASCTCDHRTNVTSHAYKLRYPNGRWRWKCIRNTLDRIKLLSLAIYALLSMRCTPGGSFTLCLFSAIICWYAVTIRFVYATKQSNADSTSPQRRSAEFGASAKWAPTAPSMLVVAGSTRAARHASRRGVWCATTTACTYNVCAVMVCVFASSGPRKNSRSRRSCMPERGCHAASNVSTTRKIADKCFIFADSRLMMAFMIRLIMWVT